MNYLQHYIVNPIRDFIYPPVCFLCRERLQDSESRVCSSCLISFKEIDASHPTWIEIQSKFKVEGVVNGLLSNYLFEKEGKLQQAIHLLKYQGIKFIGEKFGETIGGKILKDPFIHRADYLIPVPLHKLKQRERGYNQSICLCKGISRITGIPMCDSLIRRIKYTDSQTQLNLQQRKENVGDAFGINTKLRSIIPEKSFIIVDDVITTGSTINACAKQLRAHGAKNIFAVSAALAQ